MFETSETNLFSENSLSGNFKTKKYKYLQHTNKISQIVVIKYTKCARVSCRSCFVSFFQIRSKIDVCAEILCLNLGENVKEKYRSYFQNLKVH